MQASSTTTTSAPCPTIAGSERSSSGASSTDRTRRRPSCHGLGVDGAVSRATRSQDSSATRARPRRRAPRGAPAPGAWRRDPRDVDGSNSSAAPPAASGSEVVFAQATGTRAPSPPRRRGRSPRRATDARAGRRPRISASSSSSGTNPGASTSGHGASPSPARTRRVPGVQRAPRVDEPREVLLGPAGRRRPGRMAAPRRRGASPTGSDGACGTTRTRAGIDAVAGDHVVGGEARHADHPLGRPRGPRREEAVLGPGRAGEVVGVLLEGEVVGSSRPRGRVGAAAGSSSGRAARRRRGPAARSAAARRRARGPARLPERAQLDERRQLALELPRVAAPAAQGRAVRVAGVQCHQHESRSLRWTPVAATSRIFDIPIDLGRPTELLRRITAWVDEAQAGEPPRQVMYVNAHVLNQSRETPALRAALESADLVYCDGYGVRLAAKALEAEIPHRMTGADWIWGLASSLSEAAGQSIYLLGSDAGIAAEAGRRLGRWYPGLRIAGAHHGYFEPGSATTSASSRTSTRAGPTSCSWAWARRSRSCGSSATPTGWTPACCGRWGRSSTSSAATSRGPRRGWPTMDSNGSSGWRSNRSGCGGATCWATRCSSAG